MRVALRVEARTLRGLRDGMPNLMRLFSTFQVRASFFFPLGRDRSGRHPLATWRQRRQLGAAAMLYGTLLPAPWLRADALKLLRTARDNGHDVGSFGLSPIEWSDHLAHADDAWVSDQLMRLRGDLEGLDDGLPCALATPQWQTGPALLRVLAPDDWRYTSMTRGRMPYVPMSQGVRSRVPEIPTTLPTVNEMLHHPGVTDANVHEYLYAESRRLLPAGHVFAVSAEREGLDRLKLMEKLLVMWKGQDGTLRALDDVLKDIDMDSLPCHQVGWATPPGGDNAMATQSVQVLA